MIYCTNTIYGKVWKIQKKTEKYIDVQMSTSEKDNDGNYINSGWFPRIIGHAFNTLKDTLKEGDRIIITKCKFTNERYQDQSGNTKSAFKFLVFEATIEPPKDSSDAPVSAPKAAETESAQDDCPW